MATPIYRTYDRTALDAQYNCRAMVEDFDAHMARWAALSDEARARFRVRADLAYGPAPAQQLDLFLPDGDGPHPLMIFIHGGYWRSMDKNVHAFPALGFVPDGIALASIDYTLAPEADMDRIVEDCRAAVAWCRKNATDLSVDPDRIHVSGHSAGGHLTAMMMTTDWPARDDDLPPDLIKSGCPISGLYDLEPIALTYLNEDVRLTAEHIAADSPVLLRPRGVASMVVSAGGLESDEFHRQQAVLVDKWRQDIGDIEEVEMPDRHHFTVVTALAEPDSALYRAARRRILGD